MKIFVNNINIAFSKHGKGFPLLLLHGYPQTKLMWRKVIPFLSKYYTVITSDLRGYGDSDKPISNINHSTYSKREMAKDQMFLMKELGYSEFFCVGHDRGARVFHRAALDYPNMVKKLVLIDIVPTPHIYKNLNKNISESFFHWFMLSQKKPLPENLINNNKNYYIKSMLGRLSNTNQFLEKEVIDAYIKKFSKKSIIASCEDYRAGASIDLIHHEKDSKKIDCPTLVLWGKNSLVGKNFEPLKVWKKYVKNLSGKALSGGHYLPEEKPYQVANQILKFLE
jgi:haloacetate dehalogenase